LLILAAILNIFLSDNNSKITIKQTKYSLVDLYVFILLDATESDIIAEYLKRKSPVVPGLERRTQFVNSSITVQASLALVVLGCLFSKILSA
jgi:hypothetical protein